MHVNLYYNYYSQAKENIYGYHVDVHLMHLKQTSNFYRENTKLLVNRH